MKYFQTGGMKFTDETQQNKEILLVLSTNYSVDTKKA
ncbi:hypothetical protein MSP8887_00378 [Marinomonas spartinae]|uniref:Uncharacterized protein n=1 Tax=Marinomonas spartinae TaxID=1792290 RepID=A0A1A8THD2_9GAMM|nr:hypothetical protein MSP8887_00378 [Marinomonas spartinae]SBS32652.1 hypothetical protein MSP8886_02506 [Marinomonas spartinae]